MTGFNNSTEPAINVINSWQKADLPDTLGVLTAFPGITRDNQILVGSTTKGIYRFTDSEKHWNAFSSGIAQHDR